MSSYDEGRLEQLIRDDISDHLHKSQPPVFIDWLECDGLDPVGSPLATPEHLTVEQQQLHKTAVAALLDFLDSLDVKGDEIDRKYEQQCEDAGWHAYEEYRARRKNGDAA